MWTMILGNGEIFTTYEDKRKLVKQQLQCYQNFIKPQQVEKVQVQIHKNTIVVITWYSDGS